MAGVMEMAVFAMVDPQDLHLFNQPIDLPRQGIYTVSFLSFGSFVQHQAACRFFICRA